MGVVGIVSRDQKSRFQVIPSNFWKLRNRFDRRKLISMRNRSFREIGWLANIKCVEKEGRRGHVLLDDGALPFLDPRSSRFPSPPPREIVSGTKYATTRRPFRPKATICPRGKSRPGLRSLVNGRVKLLSKGHGQGGRRKGTFPTLLYREKERKRSQDRLFSRVKGHETTGSETAFLPFSWEDSRSVSS